MCHALMILLYQQRTKNLEILFVIILKTFFVHAFACHKQEKCLFKGNIEDTKRWTLMDVVLFSLWVMCFLT